ncbi:MAG: leucine--tRNA ligase [Mariprofundaceae bacterium]|nr:leucine--tRNA ligase [Mariprofundaceae bacterium]
MTTAYQAEEIELKWQQRWQREGVDAASDAADDQRPRYFCLAMFPYPSGQLHMGHVRNYCLGDAIARYKRMQGYNVLHPIGWDAFGLPAENAAIKHGQPPAVWTDNNIAQMRKQLKGLGFSYDWSREITTCKPDYYRWEQWMFLQLIEKDMAYRAEAEVNWCEPCHTVLANEQVENGCCWRCSSPVIRRNLSQWFIRITAYAEDLLNDLDQLHGWPDRVRGMQRNWIGRSTGTEVHFSLADGEGSLDVFTTRTDTLMGVTYMAVAAGHPLARHGAENNPALASFIADCSRASTKEADMAKMEKKGMPLGVDVIHPISGERIPVWVANFVLMGYGTGAVMSVPAHDERDFSFAKTYNLPIKQVIAPTHGTWDIAIAPYTEAGVLIHAGEFDGLLSNTAKTTIATWLQEHDCGEERVQYRLRDWLVSRQRYWGTPIPVIYCPDCGTVPVPEEDLPVILPESLQPTGGSSPLADYHPFLDVDCPRCGQAAQRETDTFDTFMESSWYMYRYTCKHDSTAMLNAEAIRRWAPVDQYIGGVEHAVLHLLYARFYHKLMRDAGLFTRDDAGDEPFCNLMTQGMVLKDSVKMSKSKGNTVDPQIIVDRFGADTARLFTLFAAPPEKDLEWNDAGVEGSYRFLGRIWRLMGRFDEALQGDDDAKDCRRMRRVIHESIRRVTHAFEHGFAFNVAIAALMALSNHLQAFAATGKSGQAVLHEGLAALVRMLAPFVPHIACECGERIGMNTMVIVSAWPEVDAAALEEDEVTLVIQFNGKKRGSIRIAKASDQEQVMAAVKNDPAFSHWLIDKKVVKVILVPQRLLNIVVRPQ